MKTQAEKTLEKLVACYYDQKHHEASTVPYAGTLKDEEIKKLWLSAVKQLESRK